MYKFCFYFLLYFLYCIIGYIVECSYCSILNKKIVLNRGFMIGPYLPIYGTGAMCIIFLLKKYFDDPIPLFVMSSLIATIIEYFASYVMEKVFSARWWDYTDRKYNINGRVCLKNSIFFGLGSFFIVYLVNPFLIKLLLSFNRLILIILGILFFSICITDLVVSILTIYKIRSNSLTINKDSTEEISEQVMKHLKKNIYFYKRLLNAYPTIDKINAYKKLKELVNRK